MRLSAILIALVVFVMGTAVSAHAANIVYATILRPPYDGWNVRNGKNVQFLAYATVSYSSIPEYLSGRRKTEDQRRLETTRRSFRSLLA
jgi:hypothetical protein